MTDELQKLVAELRHPRQRNERYYEPLCARAADEIERLAKELNETLAEAKDAYAAEAAKRYGDFAR